MIFFSEYLRNLKLTNKECNPGMLSLKILRVSALQYAQYEKYNQIFRVLINVLNRLKPFFKPKPN